MSQMVYRITLTPNRARRLITEATAMGIRDVAGGEPQRYDGKPVKPNSPGGRMHIRDRRMKNGQSTVRITIFCTPEQHARLSAIYSPAGR